MPISPQDRWIDAEALDAAAAIVRRNWDDQEGKAGELEALAAKLRAPERSGGR